MMFKQPKGFHCFILTEMWERYGFYVIQTILILYLIQRFHMTDELSYAVLGSVTALSYGNTVLGGIIADRWLGHRTGVLLGSVLLACAYSLMAVASSLTVIFLAFSLVTLGTGLFKPNICSLFGQLYQAGDNRRHSGFTYFYVSVNLGIIMGETLASVIQRYFGWHSTFFSASLVLAIAFIIFYYGTRHLALNDDTVVGKSINRWLLASILLLLSLFISYHVIAHPEEAIVFFSVIALVCIALTLYHAGINQGLLRWRLLAFLVLVAISTVYWALYFQMFFSMNLFVDRVVDRHFLGLTLVPAVYPSIEAFGVIVIGPFLASLWMMLSQSSSRFNPSIPMKFLLALVVNTVALGLFYVSSLLIAKNGLVQPTWLAVAYFLIAAGELVIMPIGLAMVGELFPKPLTGAMLGVFFISLGLGGKLAGVFATMATIPADSIHNIAKMEHIYQHSFLNYFLLSLGLTLVCYAMAPMLKRWMAQTQLLSNND